MRALRETRGRIVNICSIGDRIAIPFGGTLNGSKSAFAMMPECCGWSCARGGCMS
ncbi:MAG TPA: hypothetical protein VLI43_11915 [Gemmatimonadaceae bacterium]|nr:hypothetical protein [Gemmatimonadaceae bacterium]